jgi:hypothetical protein
VYIKIEQVGPRGNVSDLYLGDVSLNFDKDTDYAGPVFN